MTTSSFLKICTAAIAGTIIGMSYENLGPIKDWNFPGPHIVTALSRTNNNQNNYNYDRDKLEHVNGHKRGLLPPEKDANPKISTAFYESCKKWGLPSKDNLRFFNDFIISYDRRLRNANWVIEHLTPEKLEHNDKVTRNKSDFVEDPWIHEYFRAKNKDYSNSGYDRGHLAAAANHKQNQIDMDQTFAYTNISPQVPQLNRHAWEKLEKYVRYLAKRSQNLYVVSGPLYLPMRDRDGNLYVHYRIIGDNHVSVPTHYYKVILYEMNSTDPKHPPLAMEAFMMPNDQTMDEKINLNDYRVPIGNLDTIERASGLIFFDLVDRRSAEKPMYLPDSYRDDKTYRKRLASPKLGPSGDLPVPA